jgi:hypothetical protein
LDYILIIFLLQNISASYGTFNFRLVISIFSH